MLALSIRQPFAELILRGIKTVEYRSRATRVVGERFYIYAAKKRSAFSGQLSAAETARRIWSRDLSALSDPPRWMIELAEQVGMIEAGAMLPTGVIVGSAVIAKCTPLPLTTDNQSFYQWHLADVERAKTLRKPRGHPQPVWFKPF